MAFFYVYYVLIYHTVTSLTYVFVPLDFRPRKRIQECNLDSQGAIYLCESAKVGAVLIFWHELAINGYASMNAIKRQELIDADFQRLRKLIWPEDDR
ncbi:hypothetical protein [Escherichia coli]|uniref:hypothetical protein n=1 Tax=Escherichia coli TaxID=562 RepID=UPI00202378D0|nr:hypothetical protein [Escherichia coli]